MSLDRSLKSKAALTRHRNVLSRAERLAKLEDDGIWVEESSSVFGLQKVGHRKIATNKKEKKEKTEDAAAPAAAAPAAKVGAAAPAAKAGAPAAKAGAAAAKKK